MLGASALPSWETLGRSWDDPGTLGSTRKDIVRSRLGFCRFFVVSGDSFREIFGTFGLKNCFLIYLFPGCLFWWFLGLNLGVWDWKTSIWQGKYCKNQLLHKLDFSWSQGRFLMMLPWGHFHDFCCPGDWLEIWWLSRVVLGSSQILRPSLVEGKLSFPGL